MKSRSLVPVLLFALLTLLPVAPAAALDWGLGVDLGMNIFMPSDKYEGIDGNFTVVGWPLGSAFFFGELPLPAAGGLRVSFSGANPAHELWLGTSYNRVGFEGDAISTFGLSANYQFNFPTQGAVKPYVTLGAGLSHAGFHPEGGDGEGATSATFGGGAGIGYHIAGGVGRLRAEVRYDQCTEGKWDSTPIIPEGGNIAFRLGFDVWSRAK